MASQARAANRNEMVKFEFVTITKESAKAYELQIAVAWRDGSGRLGWLWVPKSQAIVTGTTCRLPVWLAEQKMQDVLERFGYVMVVTNDDGQALL